MKPGYKQTEVGVIPEEWEIESIESAFDVCNQLRLPLSQTVRERMAGSYPYYGPTGVQGWINQYRVEGEYALIGEDGDHFLKWHSQPMTLLVRGKFNVNNHAHLVRGTKNRTEWFYWFFANRDITKYLTRQGAGRYKLTKTALLKIPCALPPPPEQCAIAEALSDVDGLLGGLDRLIAKKRDLEKAAMQQLLTGQTRLPGFHGEWEVKTLGDVVKIQKGQLITSTTLQPGDIPVIAGGKQPAYFHATANRFGRTITISASGASAGYVALYNEPIFASDCSTISESKSYCLDFIFYQLLCKQQTIYKAQTGGAQPHIHAKDLNPISFEFPPIPEQTAIATILSDMDAELTALEQRREKTLALKQAMMQELLTGRTRLV